MWGISPYLSRQKFKPIKFEKGDRNLNIAGGNEFAALLGSRGVKAHLAMNIGTRTMGRRGWLSLEGANGVARSERDLVSVSQ